MNLGMKGRNHVTRVHSARVAGHEPRPRLHGGPRRQARLLGGHQQVQDAGAGPGSGSCATGIAYLLDCVKPISTYRNGTIYCIYCIPLKDVSPELLCKSATI